MESARKAAGRQERPVWVVPRLVAIATAFFHPVPPGELKAARERLGDTMARADETMRLVEERGREVDAALKPQ